MIIINWLQNIGYMIRIIISILTFTLLSCTNSPSFLIQTGSPSLRKNIKNAIEKSGLTTNIGIKVVSLNTGSVLYELNGNSLFNPASNNKLYTCLAALAILDTGYTFTTEVYNFENEIYLVGDGDPDLSLSDLDSLAALTAIQTQQVTTLYLDDFKLDSISYGPGWMWDEGAWWYAAQVSALSVNDNCVDFIISPGQVGRPAFIKTNPVSRFFQVMNKTVTIDDTTDFVQLRIERDWGNRSNVFNITGNILSSASVDTVYRNVDDPSKYAGTLFQEMLSEKGILITKVEKKKTPASAKLLVGHVSQPLHYSLKNLMEKSDNLTAELLVKTIGFETSGEQGNWKNGLFALKSFLNDDVKIDTSGISITDGSGVSRYNYSSPDHFIQLLKWAYNNEFIKENFLNSMPMRESLMNKKQGNDKYQVYAKTGSLAGVSALSGYIFTHSGEPLAFSILMNGYTSSSQKYFQLKDTIIKILADS